MRVALLLSGEIRNWEDPYKSLYNNILVKYNPDIFINYNWESDIEMNVGKINEIWAPKELVFDKYRNDYYNVLFNSNTGNKAPETNRDSVFKMWYGISKANKLKSDYEVANGFKYDFVIRSRFDLEYTQPLELKNFNDITIPIGWDHRGGYNDTFAYGSSEAMDYYASLFNNLQSYLIEGALLHPESILKYHLDKGPYGILRTSIPIKLRDMQLDKLEYRQK